MKKMFKSYILPALIIILMFSFLKNMFSGNDLSPQDFQTQLQENPGVVIDVRTLGEYQQGHLAVTNKQLDLLNGDFQRAIPQLDKSKTYYLYCRSGNRSGQAASMLRQQGFENVHNVGGFGELAASGMETRSGQ
jgi:phage shock protein E